MTEWIVSFTIERVCDLLIKEGKFLCGVKGQVKDMRKELKGIQCFLKDVDARQEGDEVVSYWVSEIRDIAYDVEDVIETYILKVASTREKADSNYLKLLAYYLTHCVCVDVHKAGNEIVDIKSRISGLTKRMQTYGITPLKKAESLRSIYREQQKARKSHAHVEEDFVGMEDSVDDIVGKIVRGTHHRVVSICGMGGLGKTSLAKKVFFQREVRRNFDCFAWACVSQQYHVTEILMEILIKFIPNQRKEISEMRESELFESLYEAQKKKRCLVVLDDIWTKGAWDNLRDAFPMENMSSKILLTTRNRAIPEYVDPQCYVHEPRCLSEEEGWELLKRRAFRGREVPPVRPEMVSLGKSMLRQCGGLPLAVVVLGGVLAKKTLSDWETVQRNVDKDLENGQIEVYKVLALSYEDLPYHLKPCFLYLANFPKDAAIPARKLINMWIAEGFLPSTAPRKKERTIEDDAEDSLNQLINRGLVQARVSKSGKIRTCHLHDLMRDLCIFKSREENFLNVINLQNVNEPTNGSPSTFKVRRLSIHLDIEDGVKGDLPSVTSKLKETSHLRTLHLFDPKGRGIKSWKQMQTLFVSYKFLRLLDLESFHSLEAALPKSVGDLVHLRYLNLRNTRVEELPTSLGNLESMETLDLRVISSRVTIPDVLWKMKRLKHLYLPLRFSIRDSEKLQLHSLRHLETLKNFSPSRCELKDLVKLLNLRRLTFCPLQHTEGLKQVLRLGKITLKHLRYTSFKISGTFSESNLGQLSGCCHPCKIYLEGRIQKLPEDRHFLDRTRKLILKKSRLEEDPMPKLEKLQNLIVLHLLEDAFMGKEMTCSSQGFPQLRSLLLCELSILEEWKVAEGALPCLLHLEIANCARMRRVPEGGLSSVADRQKLEIVYVTAGSRGRFWVVREGKRWVYHRDDRAVVREVQAERVTLRHVSGDEKAKEAILTRVQWSGMAAKQAMPMDAGKWNVMDAPAVKKDEWPQKRRGALPRKGKVALLIKALESLEPVPPLDDIDTEEKEEVEAGGPATVTPQESTSAIIGEASDAIVLERDVPDDREEEPKLPKHRGL